MGVFLLLTGIIVLVPLVAELRAGDRIGRELASAALLALGLMLAGAGLWLFEGPVRDRAVESGIGLTLLGLLLRPAEVYEVAEKPAEDVAPGGEHAGAAAT
ncbi:MAG: hypothetical protein PVH00_09490 [Gemmatimonadota bacterium]|jgi:hypothetical protein